MTPNKQEYLSLTKIPVLFMRKDSFLLTDFLLRSTHLSKGTASFPIISVVKLARKTGALGNFNTGGKILEALS